ncbi:MAG: isoleucine--tRNA ligase [Lachnospiraceae bacterium]|nr:isoleucine--tRNA ligase [Lachnospiraceae bacterium]
MAKDYSASLNLPKTDFPMRGNLPQREPETLKRLEEIDLYHKMLKRNEGKPSFILHDGPPFSNGNIHMGTAMNKILKDFIVKYKSMSGYYAPYVPGWDNHGMPIESAIIKQSKLDRRKMTIPEFRTACHKFAQNYVDIQMGQFKRLGVVGDWDNPYLTMRPSFEAREVKVFGEMFRKGYIYKGLKPVYWCPKDETALAEAEIEYKDIPCTSIFVKFAVKDDLGGKLAKFGDLNKTYFIIWTTTTWTLPGNLAIAVHPRELYAVIQAENGERYIVAEALAEKTMKAGGIENYEILATMPGSEFEYMKAQHPFLDRESVLLNAEYVTMDSGTGCVHTAPGFGADDYVICKKYKMDIVVPVDDRGYQTADAGQYAGMFYEDSNKAILDDMKESGALFASEKITHSYPHCWRCKSPIIFRATPQWFCSVEAFKEEAVKACESVDWIPAWGGDRIASMVRERADWCISRQRHWGLPIPVFYCADCGKPICNDDTITRVSELFGEKGSNVWYEEEAENLLPKDYACPFCGGKHFTKETNTLDGWFDSGSSHFNVLENRPGMTWPADLYLEGADQYRGWFQSSLLTAVGAKGQGAPYRQVLTHGWVVDGEGKAMHKSLGNSIAPEEMIVKYGSDLVRLWVASSDYRVDVRASDLIFKQLSDGYRKLRNTARILMADLYDFDPDRDSVPVEKLVEIDRWVLDAMNRLVKTCTDAYDSYEFHIVYHEIGNFCTTELSKLYIDITKDRLYTEKADSFERRSAQTAMYLVLSALTRLLAPMLAHTAEEIWEAMPHSAAENRESVLLNDMPRYDAKYEAGEIAAKYDHLFALRDDVMKVLEDARADKKIGKSLDAKVMIVTADAEKYETYMALADQLPTVFIVSQVEVEKGEKEEITVLPAEGCRCGRCWTYVKKGVGEGEDFLCVKCSRILGLA